MKVVEGIKNCKGFFNETVLTIGSFDGVHLGHQKLILETIAQAKKNGESAVVLTFDPHPLEILQKEKIFFRLFDMNDQRECLQAMAIDGFVVERFSETFAKISAEEFLNNYLLENFNLKTLVVGYDFSFGSDKVGSSVAMEEFCKKNNIKLIVVEPCMHEREIVSSSLIRSKILSGKVKEANSLLGRNYYIKGEVVHGDKRGRQIGFPTTNIEVLAEVFPRNGVYATIIEVSGENYLSVSNLGTRPTFFTKKNAKVFLETHILNFDQEIYGEVAKVKFVEFLRDEIRFSGLEELKEQLMKDKAKAKKVLK